MLQTSIMRNVFLFYYQLWKLSTLALTLISFSPQPWYYVALNSSLVSSLFWIADNGKWLTVSIARSLSQDQQRHILAGSVYINSHPDCGLAGGLAEASFWAFVLQDVQCALATRRPLRLATSSLEKGLLPTWEYRSYPTERDWAHRALWLLAETINYCYGPSTAAHMPPVISDVLKRKICDWEMQRPAIFQPLHFSPADSSSGRPFPALWFTSTSHGTCKIQTYIYIPKYITNALQQLQCSKYA